MKAHLNINHNILEQFGEQLQLKPSNGELFLDGPIGKGKINLVTLPNRIERYHFDFILNRPFEMSSTNPESSEWLLININLSETQISKTVNNQEVNIQKYLPSGMLFYSPKTSVSSVAPPETPFSIVLIRFHRSLLDLYPALSLNQLLSNQATIIYEDLDYHSEHLLKKSIEDSSPLLIHAYILEFMGLFFNKLSNREKTSNIENLHPDDVKYLFTAAAYLRNPFAKKSPQVEELAKVAGMGITKFNNSFKQVFGTTPLQYNLKIKMEYAKEQLVRKHSSPSEVSYELGYSHPSKFTIAFKKQFGILPSEL
ncbi:MAG: AraC family transcriptional regulator [Cytophagales bacterium]|nr:AraC family transcriptional regulator [Cytophagales bacterium]